jgi:DNA recombination protein RmuC
MTWLALRGISAAQTARASSLDKDCTELKSQLAALQASSSQLAIENAQLATSLSEKQHSFDSQFAQLRKTYETQLQANQALFDKQFAELKANEAALRDTFARLSKEALDGNAKSFIELAKARLGEFQQNARGELDLRKQEVAALVKPINETLARFDLKVNELEEKRNQAYGSISAQLRNVVEAEQQLRGKAEELASALRGQPTKWGVWGEKQLRNVVESAGMSPYCDFEEQLSLLDGDGRTKRLDLVVNLPNGRRIIVDAKAPIELFMGAVSETDEDRRHEKLRAFVRGLKVHRDDLASKRYWETLPGSPELVVLFLPRESCFSAALEVDDSLLEFSTERPVVVATPTTLIALLRAVAYGWKQEQLADNAKEISSNAAELYKRLGVFLEHMQRTGRSLGSAVDSFNAATSSLETRLLPQARRMNELGAGESKSLPDAATINIVPRAIAAPELVLGEIEATA